MQDNSNSKVNEVLKVLHKDGYKPEDAAKLIEDWSKLVMTKVYSEVLLAFSEDEIVYFEKYSKESNKTKAELEKELKEKYIQKTGKNPKDQAKEYLNSIVRVFLETKDRAEAEKAINDSRSTS